MRKIVFFLLSSFIFISNGSFAQVAGGNLAFLPTYQEEFPYFQELITGGQYEEPSRLIEGDPYYFSRQFEKGSLSINGVTYPEVPLLYDTYRDQVVTFHPVFNQKILIKPEKIDRFTLANGDRFRHVPGNQSYSKNGNGIYQILGEGEFLAISKRYKTTKPKRELSKYDEIYLEKQDFFLWKSGEFFLIQKPSQAYEILGLEKKTIKKSLRQQQLNFKQSPEAFLKFLVQSPA